ncbi:MAG: hypothetical protein H6557_22000 [Lewinellaceae bacterium]|nr:hypothetical protein [Phaeodactylibacter sp.]MCB9039296.1 hypothetical protein [Lewinellaceae bacterium]
MSEKAPQKSSNKPLAVFFFLLTIAGAWFFLQHFRGDDPGAEALATREEMLNQQFKAESANAPSLAADTYNRALETAQQGEQEYEEGRFTAAKLSFEAAADFFGRAAREATENPNSPMEPGEDNRLKQPALSAREEMRNLKNEADDARSGTLAEPAFNAALQQERLADSEFQAGNYSQAEVAYRKAGELYKKSRNEAQAKAIGLEPDLSVTKRNVESLKREMLREKAVAQQADAMAMAPGLFENALKKEQAGDRNFRADTKNGYLAAQAAYAEAKDGYRNAAETARTKAQEARARQAMAAREAEATNDLRMKIESARSATSEMKRNVVGSPSEKEANAIYQKAAKREAAAEQSFRAGDYQAAMELFREAKGLFAQASEEMVTKLNEREAEEAEEAEEAKRKRAEREIESLIGRFEQSVEGSDVNALVAFRENERSWEDFFKKVKDISVSIKTGYKKINIEDGTAQVSFTGYITYYIKSEKRTDKFDFSRDWEMEFRRGEWVVVSSRRY